MIVSAARRQVQIRNDFPYILQVESEIILLTEWKTVIVTSLLIKGRARYNHIRSRQFKRILPISLKVKRVCNIERTGKTLRCDRRISKGIPLNIGIDEKSLLVRRLPIQEQRKHSGFASRLGVRIIERDIDGPDEL